MDVNQKIRTVCLLQGVTITELAKKLGVSQPTLTNRLKTGKFSIEDYERIAKALDVEFHLHFDLPDGTKIE